MKIDLSFWRFVIIFRVAKSGTWEKNGDLYILHLGAFTDGKNTALRLCLLPFLLDMGFIK